MPIDTEGNDRMNHETPDGSGGGHHNEGDEHGNGNGGKGDAYVDQEPNAGQKFVCFNGYQFCLDQVRDPDSYIARYKDELDRLNRTYGPGLEDLHASLAMADACMSTDHRSMTNCSSQTHNNLTQYANQMAVAEKEAKNGVSVKKAAIGAAFASVLFVAGLPRCLLRAPAAGRKSFSGNTEVLMADGSRKPIKDLQPGDVVLATDPETGEEGPRQVTNVWIHPDDLYALSVNGKQLTTTEDHPFWSETDQRWERADQLDVGDLLLTPKGDGVPVGRLHADTHHVADAYNLTVAGIHAYYVLAGNTPVLVHNDGDNTTRGGWVRDNPGDWKKQMAIWDKDPIYKDILSSGNRWKINNNLVPVVDKQWIKFFPGDANLKGEKITMHHIAGERITVALPKSRHQAAHMPGGTRYNPGGPGCTG